MYSPLVTIAIPAYKKQFLSLAISSALAQTYKNIELIVVNDCSPENLTPIIESFNNERISYHVNQTNLGSDNPVYNWNKCLALAHGEFFSLLCDDDVYEPTFVEDLLQLVQKFPRTNVFRSRADFIDSNGQTTNWYPSSPEWESMRDYMWHVFSGFRKQTISEFLYRTEVLRKIGGFFPLPIAWHSDYLSVYKVAATGGIASTYRILTHFRLSGQNISSRDDKNTSEKLLATKIYLQEVRKLVDNEDKIFKKQLFYLLRRHTKINNRYILNNANRFLLLKIAAKRKFYCVSGSLLWHAFWHKR